MANGHVKLHRSITVSPIYTKPPLYLRVFERLILEANWKDGAVIFKDQEIAVKRGERITSVRQIAEWVAWYERGILKQPNPKTIRDILTWLKSEKMISIYRSVGESNSQVTHYSVLNYSQYQGDSADEVTAKVTVDGQVGKQSLDTNNKGKKEKKDIINSPDGELAPPKKKNRMQELVETWDAPDAVKAELWKFISMRGQMKKAVAVASVPDLLEKLRGMGWDIAVATLKNTVANGFTGLVMPDSAKQGRANDKDFADRGFQNQHEYSKEEFTGMTSGVFDLKDL